MEKLYVSINEINDSEFWRYNTHKSFKRVDDYFECKSYSDVWSLAFHVSNDTVQYNSVEDRYIEKYFDEETTQAFYDGDRTMMTEEIYKELCDDFGVGYLEVDVDKEINDLQEDEAKPFGWEAPVKKYLLSKKEEERQSIALHYILQKCASYM